MPSHEVDEKQKLLKMVRSEGIRPDGAHFRLHVPRGVREKKMLYPDFAIDFAKEKGNPIGL